jgi:hypothetical protein
MTITDEQRVRLLGVAKVERLQAEGMSALMQGRNSDANAIADRLLQLSQDTSDQLVSQLAMTAQAGIATGQLEEATASLANVDDRIAKATNVFSDAAEVASVGEAQLTLPFVAGKAASVLGLLQSLQQAVSSIRAQTAGGPSGNVQKLLSAFDAAKSAVSSIEEEAAKLLS